MKADRIIVLFTTHERQLVSLTIQILQSNPFLTSSTPFSCFQHEKISIGTCDELGFLTIVDRIKELIKVSGFQVSPAELEAILITHPAVAEACVIGVADEQRGELPKAFLVLKPNVSPTEKLTAEISDYVAKRVAPYKKLYAGIEYVPE